MRRRQWAVRDSIAATYPGNDALRDLFVSRWNHKELELGNEFILQINGKLKR